MNASGKGREGLLRVYGGYITTDPRFDVFKFVVFWEASSQETATQIIGSREEAFFLCEIFFLTKEYVVNKVI